VEDDAVVKAILGKGSDPLDVARGKVGPQPDDDVAAGRKGQGQRIVGHVVTPILGMARALGGLGGLRQSQCGHREAANKHTNRRQPQSGDQQ
jgi:hypothetical protein